MAYSIVPGFSSAKSASSDATLVDGPKWNASRVLSGGVKGDVLVYDTTQATNLNAVADVATGSVFVSGGIGALPAWSASPTLTNISVGNGSAGTPAVKIGLNSGFFGAGSLVQICLAGAEFFAYDGSATLNQFTFEGSTLAFSSGSGVRGDSADIYISRSASGVLKFGNSITVYDNVVDLGSSSNRLKSAYIGTALIVGTTPALTGAIRLPSASVVAFRNNANGSNLTVLTTNAADQVLLGDSATDIIVGNGGGTTRVMFSGTTSSFPALKRSGAVLQHRLADDTDYCQTDALLFKLGKIYTVATLPAGSEGMISGVSDALAPVFLGALTGGGAIHTPVYYNGSAWVAF